MSNLELEARLRCDHCGASPYLLYRRRVRQADGEPLVAYEHVLWPASPDVPPPDRPDRLTCPTCGEALTRVAA